MSRSLLFVPFSSLYAFLIIFRSVLGVRALFGVLNLMSLSGLRDDDDICLVFDTFIKQLKVKAQQIWNVCLL